MQVYNYGLTRKFIDLRCLGNKNNLDGEISYLDSITKKFIAETDYHQVYPLRDWCGKGWPKVQRFSVLPVLLAFIRDRHFEDIEKELGSERWGSGGLRVQFEVATPYDFPTYFIPLGRTARHRFWRPGDTEEDERAGNNLMCDYYRAYTQDHVYPVCRIHINSVDDMGTNMAFSAFYRDGPVVCFADIWFKDWNRLLLKLSTLEVISPIEESLLRV